MVKVVGIGFKEVGKIYWFNPEPFALNINDYVIVETVRGLELGKVVEPIKEIDESTLEHELKKVIRIASKKDIETSLINDKKALEAIPLIKNIISTRDLDMKIVDSEYTLDASKLIIYYNAEGRVDFRELVKDLAAEFKIRIELRQIGQREGAKMIGAIGTCGREVCCKKHLREFDLVTMKMAKDQGMALSSGKITGVCGKLMCCISYENDYYVEVRKRMPNVGDIVDTPTCSECKVISVDYIREIVKTTNNEEAYQNWHSSEVKRSKKNKNLEVDIDGSNS